MQKYTVTVNQFPPKFCKIRIRVVALHHYPKSGKYYPPTQNSEA